MSQNHPRNNARINRRSLTILAASVTYACFVLFFPWLEIKQDDFRDFDRYVEFFDGRMLSPLEHNIGTIGAYLLAEQLWIEFVSWLTAATGEATIALRLVSFFICMVWGTFLFSRMPVRWALVFLLNPLAIDVVMSQIRQGFAWSLIIIGFMVANRSIKGVLSILAAFLHTSSLGVLGLYLVSKTSVAVVRSKGALLLSLISTGVVLGLALTIANPVILGALTDRRVGEAFVPGGGSYLQMSFWAILVVAQISSGKEYLRRNGLVVALLVWYLVMNPFIPASFRLWAAFIPVIAASIWELPRETRKYVLYMWLGYVMLWYLYWSKLFKLFGS